MIADIITLVWKEWKEIFLQKSNLRGGILSLAIFIGISGIFLPLQAGREWLSSPLGLFIWLWFSVFMVLSMVTDAFAGERERHTLETLLASRLSDQAILLGKIAASVIYGWGMSIASILLGAVTVNIAFREGGFAFYQTQVWLGGVVFSLLGCLLMSTLGVLVSLKAPTARAAYQKLSSILLVLFLVPTLGMNLVPEETQIKIMTYLATVNLAQVMGVAAIILLVVDVGLFFAARSRFQREKLLLD
ncbi:MAG: ABC transporter permease [Anaerolineaceae bacterium]|nr:ABC transporter permease [Anaerolineaceae bacterium]NMD30249.1 ABC transporter permease [Chloroflexota bacterium]